ncbi:hypothetical protein XA67_04875 [Comamonas thiooxydans]|nr:hypothetical protein XA67_04875 [Comamonas thiooxydans]
MNHCRPYEEGETLKDGFDTLDALTRLHEGAGTEDDFLRVSAALNVAMARAADIDQKLVDLIAPSHDVMNALRVRYEQTKVMRLTPDEIAPVAEALSYAQTIMDASSPQQMLEAHNIVTRVQAEHARIKAKEKRHAG